MSGKRSLHRNVARRENTNSRDFLKQQRHFAGSCRLRGLFSVVLMGLVIDGASPVLAGGDRIELTIPLEQGQWYSRRAMREECHHRLGTPLRGEEEDHRIELTAAEKAALLLAKQAGVLDVRFESDRLTIWLPDPEDEEVRREQRNRLERLLGVSLPEWPDGKGLHVPEAFDPQRQAVLLVHGLEESRTWKNRCFSARTARRAVPGRPAVVCIAGWNWTGSRRFPNCGRRSSPGEPVPTVWPQ